MYIFMSFKSLHVQLNILKKAMQNHLPERVENNMNKNETLKPIIEQMLNIAAESKLNDWEKEFCGSVEKWFSEKGWITEKQAMQLAKIAFKFEKYSEQK